jgi:hypothetical protein
MPRPEDLYVVDVADVRLAALAAEARHHGSPESLVHSLSGFLRTTRAPAGGRR